MTRKRRRFVYQVQVETSHGWHVLVRDTSRMFVLGYFLGRQDAHDFPRLAMRFVRYDGESVEVIEERPAVPDVSVGMIVGWPTAEQYERAAADALERAERIRKHGFDVRGAEGRDGS